MPAPRLCRPSDHSPPLTSTASRQSGQAKSNRHRRLSSNRYSCSGAGRPSTRTCQANVDSKSLERIARRMVFRLSASRWFIRLSPGVVPAGTVVHATLTVSNCIQLNRFGPCDRISMSRRFLTAVAKYDSLSSIPIAHRPSRTASYASEPMPINGVSTVSPGLLYSLMHRSMVPSCSGHTCFSSLPSRADWYCRVSDSLIPVQIPPAQSIHVSLSTSPFSTGVIGVALMPGFLKIRMWSRMAGRLSALSLRSCVNSSPFAFVLIACACGFFATIARPKNTHPSAS